MFSNYFYGADEIYDNFMEIIRIPRKNENQRKKYTKYQTNL